MVNLAARASVVIPCHSESRWDQLVDTVCSVLAQRPEPVEVVVAVDHNDALLDRARREWPDITVLANRFAPGVSGNRNTGVLQTRTPLVAFLDDDARARPDWLAAMLVPFSDGMTIGCGGAIVPKWERSRPAWFPDELLWAVVGTPSQYSRPTPVRNVWSASMAVRRDVFDAVGGFRTGFGKIGNRPRPEDTDLCLRMSRASGGHWMHVPDAVVDHLVPRERSTLRAVLARCYHEGRGKIELAHGMGDANVLGVERDYISRMVPQAIMRDIGHVAHGRGGVHGIRAAALFAGVSTAAVGAIVELIIGRGLQPAARSTGIPSGGAAMFARDDAALVDGHPGSAVRHG